MNMDFGQIKELSAKHGHKRPVLIALKVKTEHDPHGDASYLEEDPRDAERLEAYQRGDWGFVGLWLRAEFVVPHFGQNENYISHHHIEGSGLWGIEDDAGRDYLQSTALEQWVDFKATLEMLNMVIPEGIEGDLEI